MKEFSFLNLITKNRFIYAIETILKKMEPDKYSFIQEYYYKNFNAKTTFINKTILESSDISIIQAYTLDQNSNLKCAGYYDKIQLSNFINDGNLI